MWVDTASSRIYRLRSITAVAVAIKAASRIASAPPPSTLRAAPNPHMLSSSPPPPFLPAPSPAPLPPLMSFPSGPAVTTAALIVAGNSPLPVSQALLGRTCVLVAVPASQTGPMSAHSTGRRYALMSLCPTVVAATTPFVRNFLVMTKRALYVRSIGSSLLMYRKKYASALQVVRRRIVVNDCAGRPTSDLQSTHYFVTSGQRNTIELADLVQSMSSATLSIGVSICIAPSCPTASAGQTRLEAHGEARLTPLMSWILVVRHPGPFWSAQVVLHRPPT